MEHTLAKFVHALRNMDVEVTPAETLDAMEVANFVGLEHKTLLKDALALTLAKTVTDKHRFGLCFDEFFAPSAFTQSPQATQLRRFDHKEIVEHLKTNASEQLVQLTEMVLNDGRTHLLFQLQQTAQQAGIEHMQTLRDKSRVIQKITRSIGVAELQLVQGQLSGEAAAGLDYVRHYLVGEIKAFVDAEYEFSAETTAQRSILNAALAGDLAQISPVYQREVDRAIDAFAERLQHKFRKKQKRQRRGQLDIRHMIRQNVAYDGAFFKLAWRRQKRQSAKVFVVCDVSGSVARLSRFLLLLLHRLTDVLPNVRAFAFSSELGEVTDYFRKQDPKRAIEAVIYDWGNGNTDYGRALAEFRAQVGDALDSKSTVIFVGDARNNLYDPKVHVLKEMSNRTRQILWFNPEPADSWGQGDSEMQRYAPFCLKVERLASLNDLKRITENLLNATR